jgi:hypothetical protein
MDRAAQVDDPALPVGRAVSVAHAFDRTRR